MADSDDEHYTIPLTEQRVFGAGIKRKRIQFVPSSEPSARNQASKTADSSSAVNRYLSIVLGKKAVEDSIETTIQETTEEICDICKLPLTSNNAVVPHETSVAHQVCLKHSHPPSSLDPRRKGLSILQAHGWDPDSRLGLGAAGEGILYPIKAKEKKDNAGIGIKSSRSVSAPVEKPKKLDAKQMRQHEKQDKRKRQRLQEMFYRNDDVERYLGGLS